MNICDNNLKDCDILNEILHEINYVLYQFVKNFILEFYDLIVTIVNVWSIVEYFDYLIRLIDDTKNFCKYISR